MKTYRTILLDFDGTVTDSGEGILQSLTYALERLGLPVPTREGLRKYVGPPLLRSFIEDFGCSPERAAEGVGYYREYYLKHGLDRHRLYDGMRALLRDLRTAGKMLILATSKLEVTARKMLAGRDIGRYFDFVAGAAADGTRADKAEIIDFCLTACAVDTDTAVMVGDRAFDIMGAARNGIDAIGVLYGYGSRAELVAAGASTFAESVAQLRRLLL